jgi:hypothetical protein
MRTWMTKHPILLTMSLTAAALAAAVAVVVDYYMSSWLILPLI